MQATHEPDRFPDDHLGDGELSPLKSNLLVLVALAAALLGLTLLDVAPSRAAKQHASADSSIDCIVASAVFAGVSVR